MGGPRRAFALGVPATPRTLQGSEVLCRKVGAVNTAAETGSLMVPIGKLFSQLSASLYAVLSVLAQGPGGSTAVPRAVSGSAVRRGWDLALLSAGPNSTASHSPHPGGSSWLPTLRAPSVPTQTDSSTDKDPLRAPSP